MLDYLVFAREMGSYGKARFDLVWGVSEVKGLRFSKARWLFLWSKRILSAEVRAWKSTWKLDIRSQVLKVDVRK